MSIESGDTFLRIGLSVALGLLIGLQREATGPEFAGLRSFALTALLGTLCGLLAERFGG
ncbi:MAG TPA: MgtC/SapB family protein, partial [Plasticicumulans sp.]|nr:MgtC/SapB family protein [Plasticicumulans sp.]